MLAWPGEPGTPKWEDANRGIPTARSASAHGRPRRGADDQTGVDITHSVKGVCRPQPSNDVNPLTPGTLVSWEILWLEADGHHPTRVAAYLHLDRAGLTREGGIEESHDQGHLPFPKDLECDVQPLPPLLGGSERKTHAERVAALAAVQFRRHVTGGIPRVEPHLKWDDGVPRFREDGGVGTHEQEAQARARVRAALERRLLRYFKGHQRRTASRMRRAASEAGLRHLTLPAETEGEARSELQQACLEGKWLPEGELAELKDSLRRYFAGEPVDFGSIPLDLPSGTAFQRAAWTACRAIPRGEVRTYRRMAEAVGSPRASRAIGQAMAANPIPIIVPCHRVVGADGSLTGFGGGLDMKARLLELEKRDYPTTSAKTS